MGIQGDKMTPASVLSAEAFVERIGTIGDITSKKMFVGNGIFHEGKMFVIIDSKGKYLMNVVESNQAEYEKKGSERHSRMPYFSIPDDVLTDPKTLVSWAKKSIKASK
jgi:DNA transformation protein and related proteins